MLAEQSAGRVKPLRANPFKPKRLAAFDRVEKIHRRRVAVANQQQGDRFVHDVFGGEESAVFAGKLLLESNGAGVMLVASVP